jgi:hypothetical protein
MYSTIDNRGRISVDCSECDRGGNGSDPDKCSCGWKVKKPKRGGCYIGILMSKYHEEARQKIAELQAKSPNKPITPACQA